MITFTHAHTRIAWALGERWRYLLAQGWLVVALYALIGWSVTWRMVRVRRWSSVRVAIAALWALPLMRLIIEALFTTIVLGAPLARTAVNSLPLAIGAGLWASLWTLYLLRSRRVSLTYPRADAMPLAAIFT